MIRFINKTTNFVYRFNEDQQKLLDKIQSDSKTQADFLTWAIITILLPLLTFTVAAGFNAMLSPSICLIWKNWPKFLLNGSIPIISFGIISSGASYLMENLNKHNPLVQSIRRRVMSIALIFLFLTSVLYIFQSVSVVTDNFRQIQNCIILSLSLIVCLGSISIGFKMYLLQSSLIPDFDEGLNQDVTNHNDELTNTYGDGE